MVRYSQIGDRPGEEEIAANMMPFWVYLTATLILLCINIGVAIVVTDVEVILSFIGSVAKSIINFLLPGLFYLITARKSPNLNPPRWKKAITIAYAGYGVVMGIFCTIMKIIDLTK